MPTWSPSWKVALAIVVERRFLRCACVVLYLDIILYQISLCNDYASTLMSTNQWELGILSIQLTFRHSDAICGSTYKRPITLESMKIGMTNTGVLDVNEDLIRAGFLNWNLLELDGTAGLLEHLGPLLLGDMLGHAAQCDLCGKRLIFFSDANGSRGRNIGVYCRIAVSWCLCGKGQREHWIYISYQTDIIPPHPGSVLCRVRLPTVIPQTSPSHPHVWPALRKAVRAG